MAIDRTDPIKKRLVRNLENIRNRINTACENSGRNPEEVRLLLATKTVPPVSIGYVLDAGEGLIGENKAQELRDKYKALKKFSPEIHFIGHLQSNKVNTVLKYVSCVQSIDRISLATKMNARLERVGQQMDVLIQVNTSREKSKFGIIPEHAIGLVIQVSRLKSLRVRGLMTIGLFNEKMEKVRPCFRLLKNLSDEISMMKLPNVEMDILSMGMSHDLEAAIEEGSTMVRVGTDIFGERENLDSYYWDEDDL